MNIEGRDFLLLAALAAAATPSWGQAAGQASSGTPSVASTPDLSGAWTHPYVGFGRLGDAERFDPARGAQFGLKPFAISSWTGFSCSGLPVEQSLTKF